MITLDASIAVQMLLRSAPDSVRKALLAADGYAAGNFFLEIRQALMKMERVGVLSPEEVALHWEAVRTFPIVIVPAGDELTFSLMRKHPVSSYDAEYLAVAMERNTKLATLDKQLARAAEAEGVLWIAPDRRQGSTVSYLVGEK